MQKGALNIIFRSGESATNLIITNVRTLGHDDVNSHKFSPDSHKFGGMALGPLDPLPLPAPATATD